MTFRVYDGGNTAPAPKRSRVAQLTNAALTVKRLPSGDGARTYAVVPHDASKFIKLEHCEADYFA